MTTNQDSGFIRFIDALVRAFAAMAPESAGFGVWGVIPGCENPVPASIARAEQDGAL